MLEEDSKNYKRQNYSKSESEAYVTDVMKTSRRDTVQTEGITNDFATRARI